MSISKKMGSAKSLIEFIDSLLDIAKGIVKKDPDKYHVPALAMKKGDRVEMAFLFCPKDEWYPVAKSLIYLLEPDMVVYIMTGWACFHQPQHYPVSTECPDPIHILQALGIDRSGKKILKTLFLDNEGNVVDEKSSDIFVTKLFPTSITEVLKGHE